MKKILGLALIMFSVMVFVPQAAAQNVYGQPSWQEQDRYDRRNRRNRRYDNRNNFGYIVREQSFYVREGRRVYLDTYRVYYTRRGQYVSSVRIRRQRVARYDHYDDYRFRRETGRGFGVNFTFRF
jgi:hypothetical protein